MLQRLSEQSRACQERAAEAGRKAEATTDPAWKADFLEMEKRWLALARSYEFVESLGDFTAENARRLRSLDEHARMRSGGAPLPRDAVGGDERASDAPDIRSIEAVLGESVAQGLLASIVESSDDAIITKNLDGVITSWNKGAERIYGYTADDVIGRSVTILMPPERHDEEPAILERVRRGERIDHYESVRRRKDGSLIDVSLTVSPVKNARGKIVGASKIARDITERRRSEELIATLAREAEHRTNNVLATVQAAVQFSQADTLDGLKRSIQARIQALAKVHMLFAQSRWAGADLSTLAADELAPYLQDAARARIDGPQVLLVPAVAQAIALTLHELATNAAKYGALSLDQGRVEIRWSLATDGRLLLDWSERGGPPITKPKRQGFGTRLIKQMITGQLNGSVGYDWRADGLVCEIAFPLLTE